MRQLSYSTKVQIFSILIISSSWDTAAFYIFVRKSIPFETSYFQFILLVRVFGQFLFQWKNKVGYKLLTFLQKCSGFKISYNLIHSMQYNVMTIFV